MPTSSLKLLRIDFGLAIPEHSTTMWSNRAPPGSVWRLSSVTIDVQSSGLAEQHAQPFCRSIVPNCSRSPCRRISFASILTFATSLTTTPTLKPSRFERMWLSSVVLPAPRNPLRRVSGTAASEVPAPQLLPASRLLRLGILLFGGQRATAATPALPHKLSCYVLSNHRYNPKQHFESLLVHLPGCPLA